MAQTTRLASFGPILIVLYLPAPVLRILQLYIDKILINVKKTRKKYIKNSPMAQTTCLASFGPILFISVLPVASLVDYNCM